MENNNQKSDLFRHKKKKKKYQINGFQKIDKNYVKFIIKNTTSLAKLISHL
jgi:hypothetical protein